MRFHRIVMAGLLVTGLAACSDDRDDEAAGPSPAAPAAPSVAPSTAPSVPPSATSSSSSGAPAPACVVGRWRATGVTSSGAFGDVRGRIAGGTGTTMNVGRDGRTEVDFRTAQPLTFTAEAAGTDVRGQVAYQGSFRAAVAFDGGQGSGRWIPQGQISWSDLAATVRLTEPFAVTLLDGASLADISRDTLPGAGGAIDVKPILRGGSYQCVDDTLRLRTQANGPDVTWTFARA